jgi:hypothetical protein
MRPKSTTGDFPSSYDVKVHLHNEFVQHMKGLKEAITVSAFHFISVSSYLPESKAAPGKVSITQDGWSADTTKMGFQGMTAHWIDVKEGKWTMRAEVIGFHALSGAHSGENLGRYSVGLLDRVGIMDKNRSKACRYHLLSSMIQIRILTIPSALHGNARQHRKQYHDLSDH